MAAGRQTDGRLPSEVQRPCHGRVARSLDLVVHVMSADKRDTPRSPLEGQLERLASLGAQTKSGGRWEAVNDRIRSVATQIPASESWELQVLAGLFISMFSEYNALEKANGSKDHKAGPLMAWHARNLLGAC